MRRFFLLALLVTPLSVSAEPITYQGRLDTPSGPGDSPHDFEVRLFDSASGGASIGPTLQLLDVPVVDGLVSLDLDFGDGVFLGDTWLEIAVRDAASGEGFEILSPRQPVRAAPVAIEHRTEPWVPGQNGPSASVSGNGLTRFVLNGGQGFNSATYLTVNTPAAAGQFGGMYIVGSDPAAWPFYGYAYANGTIGAYHYHHGGSDEIRFVNGVSDQLVIAGDGNVGVGKISPTAQLDVDGDAVFAGPLVAQDLRYTDEQERLITIPASAFIPINLTRSVSIGAILRVDDSEPTFLSAPVVLPDGARITRVVFNVSDNSTIADHTNLTLSFTTLGAGSVGNIFRGTTTGTPGNVAVETVNLSPSGAIIDNTQRAYFLGTGTQWDGSNTLLYGVQIYYKVSEPD